MDSEALSKEGFTVSMDSQAPVTGRGVGREAVPGALMTAGTPGAWWVSPAQSLRAWPPRVPGTPEGAVRILRNRGWGLTRWRPSSTCRRQAGMACLISWRKPPGWVHGIVATSRVRRWLSNDRPGV